MHLDINQKTHQVEIESDIRAILNGAGLSYSIIGSEAGNFHLLMNNRSFRVSILDRNEKNGEIRLLVNDIEITVSVKDSIYATLEKMGINLGASLQIKELKAPMPGLVLRVEVSNGTIVSKGDPLIVLEAMKMENVIKSPTDGTIDSVMVSTGDKVDKNQILIFFT